MPGPDDDVKWLEDFVASGKGTPDQRARAQRSLAAAKGSVTPVTPSAPATATDDLPVDDYTQYTTPPSGAEIVGKGNVKRDASGASSKIAKLLEKNEESKTRRADLDLTRRSASKRISLYADPYLQGKERPGFNRPFAYYEPKPETIASRLKAYRASAPAAEHKDLDEAIYDLDQLGEKSQVYREAADRLWLETRAEFERAGLPAQRVKYAEPKDVQGLVPSLAAGANEVRSMVAAPLYGADQVVLGGALSAMDPDIFRGSDNGDPEQTKVLERLKQRGVLSDELESRGQEFDPWWSTIGGLGGMFAGGLGTTAARAGAAVTRGVGAVAEGARVAPAFLRGTTLASRLARSRAAGAAAGLGSTVAGGAVGGGIAAGGAAVVDEAASGARGEGVDVQRAIGKTLEGAKLGAVLEPVGMALGALPSAVKGIGEAGQRAIAGSSIGDDLRIFKEAGGEVSPILGARRTPAMNDILDEASAGTTVGGVRRGLSENQAAVGPLAKESVERLRTEHAEAMAKMEAENKAGYARLAMRSGARTYPIVNELTDLVIRRANIPFTERARYMDALSRVSDVKLMLSSEAAASGRAKLTLEDAQKLGVDVEGMFQKGFKTQFGGRDRSDLVITIAPREMTAQELDEATRGLGALIKWGKDPDARDQTNKAIYTSLVETRRQFGDEWAATKARHDETLKALEQKRTALNLQGRDTEEIGSSADIERAEQAWSGYGGKDPGQVPKDEALMETLPEGSPLRGRAQAFGGNKARARLQSGGPNQSLVDVAMMPLRATALRADPVFGMMRGAGSSLDSVSQNAKLRAAVEKVLGPGVQVPDSMLGFVGSLLGVTQATMQEEP